MVAAFHIMVPIPAHLSDQTDRSLFEIDFFWEEAAIAAEYDSDAEHKKTQQQLRDTVKRNVMPALGYTSFAFTTAQVNDPHEMDKSVQRLRVMLKHKPRAKGPANYHQRQQQLRRELGLPA